MLAYCPHLVSQGARGVYLAIIIIFECLVVLASIQAGYSHANTECLRKVDRTTTKKLKYLRDTTAHAFYDKTELNSKLAEFTVCL